MLAQGSMLFNYEHQEITAGCFFFFEKNTAAWLIWLIKTSQQYFQPARSAQANRLC
jgi:hypothetical protein